MNKKIEIPTEEDAFICISRYLREGRTSNYGYDLYLPNVMRSYLTDIYGNPHENERYLPSISPAFYAASWNLCRRGILRPGVSAHGKQATLDGSAGNGYSVTPFGKQWIQESDQDDFVPTEPERFAKMLDSVGVRFGIGFRERSQEAIRCYGAHAYLACCAMCGAAAESILLSLAIKKTNDEYEILKTYNSTSGRRKIEDKILSHIKQSVREEFHAYFNLLKYWRDSAAHGQISQITDTEAYTSLALLLRLAQFASDRWENLTQDLADKSGD